MISCLVLGLVAGKVDCFSLQVNLQLFVLDHIYLCYYFLPPEYHLARLSCPKSHLTEAWSVIWGKAEKMTLVARDGSLFCHVGCSAIFALPFH